MVLRHHFSFNIFTTPTEKIHMIFIVNILRKKCRLATLGIAGSQPLFWQVIPHPTPPQCSLSLETQSHICEVSCIPALLFVMFFHPTPPQCSLSLETHSHICEFSKLGHSCTPIVMFFHPTPPQCSAYWVWRPRVIIARSQIRPILHSYSWLSFTHTTALSLETHHNSTLLIWRKPYLHLDNQSYSWVLEIGPIWQSYLSGSFTHIIQCQYQHFEKSFNSSHAMKIKMNNICLFI